MVDLQSSLTSNLMELFAFNFTFFSTIPLFFLLLLTIQICKAITKTTPTRKKLPPGPWKFPIIGSLHHLVGFSLPHHVFRALAKKHGPIMHLQLGELSTVVISSARLAKEVLKDHDLAVANRPQFLASKIILYDGGDLVFAPYGKFWRQMHKICVLEVLSAKKVRSFHLIREEEVSRVVESIRSSSGSHVNLSAMIYSLLNIISCRAVFGSKCKDQDGLIEIILEMVGFLAGLDAANLFPSFKLIPILNGMMSKVKKTHQKLDRILDDIIDDHRENIGTIAGDEEDLVDVLLRVKETGGLDFPFTLDNIKGLIMDMFGAGTETSSTVIEWAMSEMIRNPRVMEKAQAELREVFKGKKVIDEADLRQCSYLKMVIKETLRLRNPFLLSPRLSREQFEIEGYTIPEKTTIIVNFSAIARDPEYWHDAESYLPERFEDSSIDFKGTNFEYIPFGAGRRMCPGISFAMASVELVLAQLLYHFDWKLPNGTKPEDLDMTERFGLTVRRENSLSLIATPYSSP